MFHFHFVSFISDSLGHPAALNYTFYNSATENSTKQMYYLKSYHLDLLSLLYTPCEIPPRVSSESCPQIKFCFLGSTKDQDGSV